MGARHRRGPVPISLACDRPVPPPIHRSILSADSVSDTIDSADPISSRARLLSPRLRLQQQTPSAPADVLLPTSFVTNFADFKAIQSQCDIETEPSVAFWTWIYRWRFRITTSSCAYQDAYGHGAAPLRDHRFQLQSHCQPCNLKTSVGLLQFLYSDALTGSISFLH